MSRKKPKVDPMSGINTQDRKDIRIAEDAIKYAINVIDKDARLVILHGFKDFLDVIDAEMTLESTRSYMDLLNPELA